MPSIRLFAATFASLRLRNLPRSVYMLIPALLAMFLSPASIFAQGHGGEANLILPDLSMGTFMGTNGRTLLMGGLVICALGLMFGLVTYMRLRDLPVHKSMLEVSELIWETCKTYLWTQGRFLLILEIFIGAVMLLYFGYFQQFPAAKLSIDEKFDAELVTNDDGWGKFRYALRKVE